MFSTFFSLEMFIPSEMEQISLPLDNVKEKLEPMEPNQDYIDAFQLESELMDSPALPNSTIYTDVNVVPEHEKGELGNSISNLEGKSLKYLVVVTCCLKVLSFHKFPMLH